MLDPLLFAYKASHKQTETQKQKKDSPRDGLWSLRAGGFSLGEGLPGADAQQRKVHGPGDALDAHRLGEMFLSPLESENELGAF